MKDDSWKLLNDNEYFEKVRVFYYTAPLERLRGPAVPVKSVCVWTKTKDGTVAMAVSQCSPDDVYISTRGRAIAAGRVLKLLQSSHIRAGHTYVWKDAHLLPKEVFTEVVSANGTELF